MNNLIDQIDAYLDGTLSPADKTAFEAKLANDESLRQALEVQKNLRAGIERLGMKTVTASTFKKMTLKSKLYKWGVATVVVTAIATSVYYGMNSSSSYSEDGPNITYELPATNENGGTEWATADRNLPTQLFEINPNKDTVIETMSGMVFAIPAGAFLNATDPITLEIKEALTPMDIMKGGLSTTSNGELLETGGMFYLNARNGETSLKINPDKPVYANVPTNEIRPGMQLFDGERKPDGSINWVNPKQIEKQLIPVDIFSLNFYPAGFQAKCAELGFDANNKKVTDSIYYSYAGRKSNKPAEFDLVGMMGPKDSIKIKFLLVTHVGAIGAPPNVYRTHVEAEYLSREAFSQTSYIGDFDELVKKYSDHSLPDEGREVWITKNSKNHQDIASVILSDGAWMNYHFSTERGWYVAQNLSGLKGGGDENLEIDPARIAAIQTAEFQNTIIATREFEDRLQTIFSKGEPGVLDLYINNLDKKMYEIDSMVYAEFGIGEFEHYYLRKDGGIAISQSHMKELQEYYQKKQEAARIASEKTYNARTAEQRKQDSAYFEEQSKLSQENAEQSSGNFATEFNSNLKDAYRQLGLPVYPPPPAGDYYGVTVATTGWHNVDKYVYESVVSRNTLDYTDSLTGKKAVIKYEPLQINIADQSNYSQLMVYLVTDSLPCFMKLNEANGEFTENLNERFEYGLVVIAEKDGIWFSSTTPKVTPGSVNVTLSATDETTLRSNII